MVVLKLTLIYFIAIRVAIHGSESANFPLDDCFIAEMDVLFLHFVTTDVHARQSQHNLFEHFIDDLLGVHSNETNQRVMFADVIDSFSAFNPNFNVSSWVLHSSLGSYQYGLNEEHISTPKYHNVKEIIELKVTFVKRLFSEMGGVRKNVTHFGVIFLDGSGLSYEESRSVPHILQPQVTNIKIFFVLVLNKYYSNTIYLSDTLIVNQEIYNNLHMLTTVICNKCMDGWFMFEHETAKSRSCYQLLNAEVKLNWHEAAEKCYIQNAYLSTTESENELNFLRTKIISYFTESGNYSNNTHTASEVLSAEIFIGLLRDSKKSSEKFHWLHPNNPLVINNWLPGKPSGGRDNECGIWRFIWNHHCNDTCRSLNNDHGWIDIECKTKVSSFSLCEMYIPVRFEKNMLKIKPARKESLKQVLSKGNFITFAENIVSVTANIANNDFLQFLKQSGIEIPIFDCGVEEVHPRYISYVYVCDYVDHCRNKRDETFCDFNEQIESDVQECQIKCPSVQCCDGSCLPLQFINDGEIDCFVCGYGTEKTVHDESEIIIHNYKRNKTCAFFCDLDECISQFQLNDGYRDCIGSDGFLDETIGKLQTADTCYNSLGQSIWAPLCVYVLNRLRVAIGCRDMSHLHNCTDFECPEGYFKCPETYCIPQHYVLDGKSDCPTGEDEQLDIISPCSGNFACWGSQICLHPDLVCDGHIDCPYQDDELDCGASCPEGFQCMSGTITVSDYNRSRPLTSVIYINKKITYMDLTGLDLSTSNLGYFIYLNLPHVIILSNCKINTITKYFSFLAEVRKLDLSYNLIQNIDGSYVNYSPLEYVRHLNLSYNKELVIFKYLHTPLLETLDLSHTGLRDIDGSFLLLLNLKHLNLSFTFATEIQNSFDSKLILQTLDLRGLTIMNLHVDMFKGLTIRQDLYTDSFELCCPQIRGINIPYYTCHAPEDAISSCFNLIGDSFQRVLLWAVAVLAALGNITVIGYRIIWDRSVLRTSHALFVTNLGISDFIMGVYLFIIAGADYYYRDFYVLYDKMWRESITCRIAGFLTTLSSETSIFFIFLITLDRFLLMKFPFGEKKFTNLPKVVAVLSSWIIGIFLAMSPNVFSFEIYSSNAMCLGLPLTSKEFKGWRFSFAVFIVFNFCMCLIIIYSQRAIFRAMSMNRITTTALSMSPRRAEYITVIRQLSLIATFNFMCWFPVGIMGLMLLAKYEISKNVYAWTTIILLPINSAVNPLLYTIPAIMTRWVKFKDMKVRKEQRRS